MKKKDENNIYLSFKHIHQKRNIQTLSYFSYPIVLLGNGLAIKSMTADLLNKAAIFGFRSWVIEHKSKSSAQKESKLTS